MKVISWNLAGRTRLVPAQVAFLAGRSADVVALQEVTKTTLPLLTDALADAGFGAIANSFNLAPDPEILTGPRRYGQIIAAKFPIQTLPPAAFDVPWPERILSVAGMVGGAALEIHTTHIPPGVSNKWIKIETFEGIYRRLAAATETRRLLCGDFNSPQCEFADGRVMVWGQREGRDGGIVSRNHRGQPPGRWANGERSVILDLAAFDLSDVFRRLHGYERQESSWYHSSHKENGRRFDHVFASAALNPTACRYLHAPREAGLSDHSPIEAEFNP